MTEKDLILKAKEAKSAEELIALAKENGIELSADDAKLYLDINKNGELADEELTDVSGGGVYFAGRLIVTRFHVCDHWKCPKCGFGLQTSRDGDDDVHACPPHSSSTHYPKVSCLDCKYQKYVFPYHLCTHPDVRKY